MKRLLNKAFVLALMATTWVGCSQEDHYLNSGQESESDIQISLNLNVPDLIQVTSRAVTEGIINNFTVLCFDKDDKALVKYTLSATGAESGTLTVTIPNATRVMHVFANQESSSIPFEKGVTSEADLQNLAATADNMIYWGRIAVPADITSSSAIKTWWTTPKSISLLRSHAKVEVVNNNTDEFVLQGYTVVYTNASGLAIPYDTENGVYPTVEEWLNGDFIHAAAGATVSGTDKTMQTSDPIYVYETSASAETPASIIIKGYNKSDLSQTTKYWRVAFADEEGNKVNIRRNHRYTVSIEGSILFGDTDFAAAVASSSTANSAWLGIADEVTAIKNRDFSLTVENTSYVKVNGTESLSFNFDIEQLGEEAFKMADLSVTWAEGQDVSTSTSKEVSYNYTTSGTLFSATVNVALKSFTDMSNHEGTIVIKYGKKLQRKVKIIIIPQQAFTITSYNGVTSYTTDENGAHVYEVSVNKDAYEKDDYTIDGAPIDKLLFSLPVSFPEELLPLNVLVSTTDFNVVNSPLIFEGDGGYGDKNIGPGYKYVFPVNAKHEEIIVDGQSQKELKQHEIQLRYINNLLADKVELTLEAENFVPMKLIINYTIKASNSEGTE